MVSFSANLFWNFSKHSNIDTKYNNIYLDLTVNILTFFCTIPSLPLLKCSSMIIYFPMIYI